MTIFHNNSSLDALRPFYYELSHTPHQFSKLPVLSVAAISKSRYPTGTRKGFRAYGIEMADPKKTVFKMACVCYKSVNY